MASQAETIKNISYNQHEILWNIMQMHNDGKAYECDPTYSIGNFYGKHSFVNGYDERVEVEIPQPKYKFDVCPQTEDTVKIEPLGKWGLENESVNSIVIDPPFVCSPNTKTATDMTNKSCLTQKRFASYYPIWTLMESYSHLLSEAYRVLKDGGICVFKCQNTISARKFYCSEEFTWFEAQKQGFYVLDKAILCATTRLISPKHSKQEHFRNYASVFWVFKKDKKMKPIDYYSFFEKRQKLEEKLSG